MTTIVPHIEASWAELLASEFQADYFVHLKKFLTSERSQFKTYPSGSQIFAAFNRTPVSKVKVVILGQDPYHGPGQANGLCFSVNNGIRHPPSLQNIFKELHSDLGLKIPVSGDLGHWADQGILLLNATLTVRDSQPGSHQGHGWERFTDAAITKLATHQQNIVFLLWGGFAQQKDSLISKNRGHLILKAPHPSPLSAHRGFFGCKHFSQVNAFLHSKGSTTINWQP